MPQVTLPSGMTIAYEVTGEGAPVLFVQGAGVPGSGWAPQVSDLAKRFRCLSFDNRGIGSSGASPSAFRIDDMCADAIGLMDSLSWKTAHVVGHSIGGLVAQALALQAKHRVRSLTLMCSFLRGSEPSRFTPWIAWTGLRTYVGTRRSRRLAFLEILLSDEERRARGSKAALDAFALELMPLFGRDLADPAAIAMKQLRAVSKFDASARLSELSDMPTLVLSATHDRLALPAFGRALANAIPGARYEELDASHGLPISRPKEVNTLLTEHFANAAQRSATLSG